MYSILHYTNKNVHTKRLCMIHAMLYTMELASPGQGHRRQTICQVCDTAFLTSHWAYSRVKTVLNNTKGLYSGNLYAPISGRQNRFVHH